MQPTAVALRHVHFEDLGSFAAVLDRAGYALRYLDVGVDDISALDPLAPDILVVLGGPIGVYETDAYPFIEDEIDLLKRRLAADRPTFGICLGAQLLAVALGATVAPTGIKEIGFAPLQLTAAGQASLLRHLADVPVLHWHGDAFAIPEGATHLASTSVCASQAFSCGPRIMGVQFHPETDPTAGLERWLIGHAGELASAGIDPRRLRVEAAQFGAGLVGAGRAFFRAWLEAATA